MAEQVVLDIKIPTSDVESAEQAIGRMRGQVEKLKEANKNLDKSSDAYTKNALEIKRLNGEIRTNERVLIANTKAQNANEGSVEQLREQLKIVSVEWAKVTKAEGENTKRSKELTAQKKKLTEQLKKVEAATGDTRRNVGNYSEGMREALASSGLFTREQQALATAQKAVQLATSTATMATKSFRAALISTGIGAVVVALGTLITYLTQTQKGMDLVNQVLEGAKAILQVLIDRVLMFGEGLYDIFVKRDFRNGIDKLKTSFQGLGEEIVNESKAAANLEKQLQEIEKAEARLNVERAKGRKELAELKLIADDTTKSEQERAEAAQRAIDIENANLAKQIELQEKRIEVLKQQNELGTSTEADLERVRQAEIRLFNLQEESLNKQLEIRNKLNALNKETTETTEKATEATEKQVRTVAENIERINEEFLLKQKELLLQGEIDRDEYNARILAKEIELLNAQIAARKLNQEETLELENQLADKLIEQKQRVLDAEKAGKDVEKQLNKDVGDQEFGIAKQSVELAQKAAGDNVEAQKAAALITTGINIAESVTKALAQGGPIAGPILAAISTALGAVQQAKIRSAKAPGFAEGVIGLDGPGTETSDSINARLSKGESVITAKATSAFAPQLAEMERAVGNRPNYQMGNRKFANGIIAAGNNPGITSGRNAVSQSRALVQDLRNMKMFLSLTELEERQTEFRQAQQKAEITELG